MRPPALVAIAALAVVLGGCGSSESSAGAVPDAGGEVGTVVSADSSDAPRDEQTEACADYVACIGASDPAALADTLDAYGPSGTCWSQGAAVAETCDGACKKLLVDANGRAPHEKACALCESDADCTDPALPNCDPAVNRCASDPTTDFLRACQNDAGCPSLSCLHERCRTEFDDCFAPGGKCDDFVTCTVACGCSASCSTSCVAQAPPACLSDCVLVIAGPGSGGPLGTCGMANACGC